MSTDRRIIELRQQHQKLKAQYDKLLCMRAELARLPNPKDAPSPRKRGTASRKRQLQNSRSAARMNLSPHGCTERKRAVLLVIPPA